jgi:hypothetical protein
VKAVSGALVEAFSSWLCYGGALGSNLGMGRVTRLGRMFGIEAPDMSSGHEVAADFGSEGACDETGVGDAGDWGLHDWIN